MPWRWVLVVVLALLAACAWISGPCKLDTVKKLASCEAGGWMLVVPPKVLENLPGMPDKEKSRP